MRENFLIERVKPKTYKDTHYFGILVIVVYTLLIAVFISGCAKDQDTTNADSGLTVPLSTVIAGTFPVNNADTVVINPVIEVTFKSSQDTSVLASSTLVLKQGTIPVAGTVGYSKTSIQFIPQADLKPETKYTATIKKIKGKNSEDKEEHSWTFKTGKHRDKNSKLTVISVNPLNGATDIATDFHPVITFNKALTSTITKTLSIKFQAGTTTVSGKVSYSGINATFTPAMALLANTQYTGTVSVVNTEGDDDHDDGEDNEEHKSTSLFTWSFTTKAGGTDVTAPTILSVLPANNASSVAVNVHPTVTFSEAMNAGSINSTTFTLKKGSTSVPGSVAYSGTTATYTPSANLVAGSVYTATISNGAKDAAGNALASAYTWSFTIATATDVTPPTVLSVAPVNNATNISASIHPSATFSEAMNSGTINSTTFTLKKGTTAVAGTVAYSGTTATFTPSANLEAGSVYTATITNGAKDAAGNALASDFTWSFTIATAADVTPPTVLSVAPANNATSVPINSNVTATFSEAMNSTTINSTTFTLKQGSTSVSGTVTYSGTTATFNPGSDLAGGMVYTATITTGAKDAAGNAITSSKVWSFTTVASAPAVSFANDVLPILQSRCMPCHGATSPTAGISITNYSTVSKLSNSQLDNSSMYPKLGTTAAEQATIKAWIAAGRPNN
jgi:hypothetical protein